MSSYQNNDINHVGHQSNYNPSNFRTATNGPQNGPYQYHHHSHQTENECRNRDNLPFSIGQVSDMSSQSGTRPTSKTALLVRQRRAMLEQLSCFICKGYLIDATTIGECMDSFCKSCIVTYLRSNNHCPKCRTPVYDAGSFSSLKSDKVLQDIVYKLIPGLYDNEMKRRREFYRRLYGASSSDDSDEESLSINGHDSNLTGEKYGFVAHPKPFYKPSDSIDLSIEPQTRGDSSTIFYDNKRQSIVTCFTGNSQHHDSNGTTRGSIFSSVDVSHFKTYLRCPARFTVLQLKKFIAAKFNTCRDDTIHLLYLNESLKEEYSLIDVAYIYDWRGLEHMRLFYIIERDLTNSAITVSSNNNDQPNRSAKVTRQSVGISTQTVKRVCIDPEPKFYEVNNREPITSNSGGRSMRSRSTDVTSTKSISTHASPNLNLRATYNPRECAAPMNIITSQAHSADRGQNNHMIVGNSHQVVQRSAQCTSVTNGTESKAKRCDTKETRSLRSQQAASTKPAETRPIPKISISLSALNQSTSPSSTKNNQEPTVQARPNPEQTNQLVALPRGGNIAHMVPYTTKNYTAATISGATQSSLVTLASFTEARSNHVMATMSSSTTTAATISDSYRNLLGVNPTSTDRSISGQQQQQQQHQHHQQPRVQAPPQLALSFVTKRGIIIRRLNHQDDNMTGSNSCVTNNSLARPQNFPQLTGPERVDSNSDGNNNTNIGTSKSTSTQMNHISAATGSSTSSSTSTADNRSNGSDRTHPTSGHSRPLGEGSVSPRHHIKVKPVYKTFVDPTKLKSPNFKKLGYTARHPG